MGEINNAVKLIAAENPNYFGNPVEPRDLGITGVTVASESDKTTFTLDDLLAGTQASRAVFYDENGGLLAETTDVDVNVIKLPDTVLDASDAFTVSIFVMLKDGQQFAIPVVNEP